LPVKIRPVHIRSGYSPTIYLLKDENSVASLRNTALPALLAGLFLTVCLRPNPAYAANQPIAGSGCVNASSADDLGTAPDHMSDRKVIPIGVRRDTPLLDLLRTNGHTATLEEFLAPPPGQTAARTGEMYVLLVGARHICSENRKEAAAMQRAKATGVPIVVESFEKSEFKTLTGLGLKSESAVVVFAPGGRGQTISLIHPPPHGHTYASALDAVNRAIDKHVQSMAQPTLDPTRQAYAENIWTVWLHTANVVCTLPYYAPEDKYYPQTGNLDFGVQLTLVAQTEPLEKAINIQYIGAGFTPLAPNVLPIDSNYYFKGAYTLDTSYSGILTARHSANLTGTASTVQPSPTIGSHTVAKTNGFSWGLRSSCGGNSTGPGCTVTADFSFSSTRQNTQTIAERVIDASSSFGTVADPNGTICGDPVNGCWEATHDVADYLASTATSDGGKPVNLLKNSWYGFYNLSGWSTDIHSTPSGDAISIALGYSDSPPPLPNSNTVRHWPKWSSSSALTEGEAGYTFSANYTQNLTLNATVTGEEGIFSIGVGPKEKRQPSQIREVCLMYCSNVADYALDLYTNTATAAATINIDAAQVNYSGMPTCAMRQYTQPDLGIFQILNHTNTALNIGDMSAYPFQNNVATVADDYRGSDQWLVGVSSTSIQPGQYQYVALCSSTQNTTPSMKLLFTGGANGALTFDGSGNPLNVPANVTYNAAQRVFTIH
jgi:hypothetical protein